MTDHHQIVTQPASAPGLTRQADAASPRAASATIAQIEAALHHLCTIGWPTSEADLVQSLIPTISAAMRAAISYRQTGALVASEYAGWWRVIAEIDDTTKTDAEHVISRVRLQ